VSEVLSHPWLDIGHHIHQKSDETVFPAVEFYDLAVRLDSLKAQAVGTPEKVEW